LMLRLNHNWLCCRSLQPASSDVGDFLAVGSQTLASKEASYKAVTP